MTHFAQNYMKSELENADLIREKGWIDGSWTAATKTFAVVNPATLECVANVADLGEDAARRAISAAHRAFGQWRFVPVAERVAKIALWADLIERHADALAEIVVSESGKRLVEAQGEIHQCAALLRWFTACADKLQNSLSASSARVNHNMVLQEPVGVVACITPWNFPAAAIIVKAGAAITAGCATIVKPSEETPLIGLALAQLSAKAGLPTGVFNVIPCSDARPVGAVLCSSDIVRMLSFTGSTGVGKQLYAACGSTVKRLALELGGNAPFVVFDDADLEEAVTAALGARFYNSGQICVGANRFLVQRGIYDQFAKMLSTAVAKLVLGDGRDPNTDVGPMINRSAIERLRIIVHDATAHGAMIAAGGQEADDDSLFFKPTVLANMSTRMRAYRTEIFGPIACLYQFDADAEALEMANDTEAGLSAYAFSTNEERLAKFGSALEAGVVGLNSANIFSNDMPFGGIKQSGIGREHGVNCLDEYLEVKSVFRGP